MSTKVAQIVAEVKGGENCPGDLKKSNPILLAQPKPIESGFGHILLTNFKRLNIFKNL
jgi:hypothetical protein